MTEGETVTVSRGMKILNFEYLKNIAYFAAMKRMKRLKKKSLHRRQKIYNVATLSFKESVLTVAQDRSDQKLLLHALIWSMI